MICKIGYVLIVVGFIVFGCPNFGPLFTPRILILIYALLKCYEGCDLFCPSEPPHLPCPSHKLEHPSFELRGTDGDSPKSNDCCGRGLRKVDLDG